MAQSGVQMEQKAFSCSLCLDLLKDPVLLLCRHSYCMSCIETFWDKEDDWGFYSCPQCKKSFKPKPVLEKNTMLETLVEEIKQTGLQTAPVSSRYAGPEDVACDFCTGRKRKVCKSCLQCLASYCEENIEVHCESPVFKKHKLMEPSKKIQKNTCPQHKEVVMMFCRTEQQPFCHLCSVDQHKGHDTVSAAAERTKRQKWLDLCQKKIQQAIRDREKDVELLQQELEAINASADVAVEHSKRMFAELILLMEKRYAEVKQQVRSRQKTEEGRLKKPQEKLKQEIANLKRKDAELQKLSQTDDDNQFLQDFPSLSALRVSAYTSSIDIRPVGFFTEVKAAVTGVRNKLHIVLKDKWKNVSQQVSEVSAVLLQLQPQPRLLLRLPEQLQPPPPPEPQQQQPLLPPKPEPEKLQPLLYPKPEPEKLQPLLYPKPEPEQPQLLLLPKPEPEQLQPLLLPKPEPEKLQPLLLPKPEQPLLSKLNVRLKTEPGPELSP